jgi:hypothetical protein
MTVRVDWELCLGPHFLVVNGYRMPAIVEVPIPDQDPIGNL